ncbi:uncharacterized protein LOC135120827 [Zophobas morio]|uniref:uncharacterized protein LOC135120827 n=1 Tax=Zophobas morio TaxID=2755281 RepID=UPI003083E105
MTVEREIKTLKTKRAVVKRRFTQFAHFFNDPINKGKIAEIEKRLEGVQSCMQEFENCYMQLHDLDESQVNIEDLNEFENEFYRVVTEAETFVSSKGSAEIPSDNIKCIPNNVKLPDIQLPTFTGIFTEWISFRDTYLALIHNSTLTPIQKFHYLKGTLKGDAKQTIEHLTPTAENYESAWSLLEARYENNRLIAQHHVRALFALPAISNKDSKSLRSLIQALNSNLKALENLGRPTSQWDDLLIYIITSKFDHNTIIAWETTLSNIIPSMQDMSDFLNQRCQMWESLEVNATSRSNSNFHNKITKNPYINNRVISHVANTSAPFGKCLYCKEMHNIYNCPNFLNLSIEQRINEIKKRKLCLNCLKGGHKLMSCNSSNCKKCNKRHNSLLHINERETSTSPEPSTSSLNSVSSHCAQILNKNITLSTAMINVCDEHGKLVQFRILLDNGSVSNFITERAVKQLGLKNVQTINLSLIGIGCSSSVINKTVSARISSIINNFNAKLEFLIVSEITGNIPSTSFSPINDIPINIKLADPLYNESKPVDILIGNEIFWDLMCVGQIRLSKQGPVLQKTQLGWIIGGVVGCFNNQKTSSCHVTNHSLEQEVKRFWEIEQYSEDQPPEINNICEKYFLEGSKRLENGRFSVKLPFVTNPPDIGESRNKALRLFYNLERRLHKDPHLFKQYSEFMATYLILGHMTEVANPNNSGYFLSHHPVINESSITTKLRVVFNASMQTTNNKSINDSLLVGPNLQQDLFGILIRFRFYKIVITGDIQKMYRQILLHEDHRKYQQIFWRDNINEPVKVFQLNTITYGFASSSYLATRCLLELARYAELEFPDAARTISTSFYVDDLICGGDTPEQAAQLLQEIKSILKGGGFELHKLNSNYPQVIYGNEQVGETYTVSLDKQGPTKTLGVLWDNNADAIRFSTWEKPASKVKVTKRIILSTVAKIFDPLGLVAPVTVTAKIILQKLWALKINWDESVPCDLYTIWKNFMKSLPELNSITIPRRVIHDSTQVQLHGFCDASQYAYGACIYLRTMDPSDWHYVPSSKNPADILSRGATPLQLKMSQMWWTGPNFLEGHHQNIQFVKDERTQLHIPEVKSVCCSSVTKPSVQFDLLTRFSTFSKLIRVTAFILRFINKALNKTPKFNGHLSCEELQRAHDCVIKLLQAEAFSEEIHNLKNHRQLLHNNKICNLNPFLDHKGLLRVGGRLKNSNLDVEQKHQLLLPKGHHVTRLIIKNYHEDNLHSGCLATLSAIRQKYWPIAARSLIRRLMGDLPKERITQARPFLITGIDYGGPFVIKNGVLGETLLNFEEMNTLLAMIEACLNSRPIIPISEDPNDLSSLTPGHFLIGTPLTAPAEPIVGEVPTNRMNRYQLVESLRQHFWQRWSKEYLHNMQQRTKWSRTPTQRPALGDLVILKEDNTQPLQWPLGRICDIHPGQDGHCRVVTVKTVRGVYKRPLSKVCVVPRENEETRALNLSNKPPTEWKETKTTKREMRRRVCLSRVSRGQFDLAFLSSKTSERYVFHVIPCVLVEEAALLLDGYGVCETREPHICELRVCDSYVNGRHKMAALPDDAMAVNFRTTD